MEFFEKPVAVRLKTHLDKYLVADDDQLSIRQSQSAGGTRRARWLIQHVDSNNHVIRLKSCFGRYLTASNTPFLLGMTGKKVFQTLLPENTKDQLAIEWQPVRDGFQVKLKSASSGTYLRANGATMPWRNTVTHDSSSFTSSSHNWILFDVEAVDIPEDEGFNDYLSMVSTVSSVFDELSGLEFHGSPVTIHSSSFSPRFPIFSMKKVIPCCLLHTYYYTDRSTDLCNHLKYHVSYD